MSKRHQNIFSSFLCTASVNSMAVHGWSKSNSHLFSCVQAVTTVFGSENIMVGRTVVTLK